LDRYPTINKIAFTGRLAEKLYEINFGYLDIDRVYLPSPSSAYAKMSLEKKIVIYKDKLGF
jgi:G:T/U-mismatch repair DNA glycosylase